MRKNEGFLLGMLVIVMAFGLMFCGCATTGGGDEKSAPGVLTITGIPKEFDGKFVLFSHWTTSDFLASSVQPKNHTARGVTVKDGAVTLPLYSNVPMPFVGTHLGYSGNHTRDIYLAVGDTVNWSNGSDLDPIVFFKSVKFENGNADIQWNNSLTVKQCFINISNIPVDLNDKIFNIWVGFKGSGMLVDADVRFNAKLNNGTLSAKYHDVSRSDGTFAFYTKNGTKDIAIAIADPTKTVQVYQFVLFRNAQITDGRVTLNFVQGVRQ